MTERERLIEKLIIADRNWEERGLKEYWEHIADYLLDHGVIVPPCKVGDKIWYIHGGKIYWRFVSKQSIYSISKNSAIGHSAFLTREEAEKALKARDNNA